MERRNFDGIVDAKFSVQPTQEEMDASYAEFQKVLKMFNGDYNKAVDHFNEQNNITAEDLRRLASDII